MEALADILKITIPALIVFFTAYFLMRNMIRNDQDKRRQELILQNSRTVTPIKLQAYERIVLFLERISLESMLAQGKHIRYDGSSVTFSAADHNQE